MIVKKLPTFAEVWPTSVRGWKNKLLAEITKGLMFPETRYPVTRHYDGTRFTVHLYNPYTEAQFKGIEKELAESGWAIVNVKQFFNHTNLILTVIEPQA